MYLFILESVGTTELILIGIVALVLLGPRKLPEMARKAGKIMAEFRGTAAEFKETWQREVDFEAEAKAFSLDHLEGESVPRSTLADNKALQETPTISEVDVSRFDGVLPAEPVADKCEANESEALPPENDKKNWL